MAKLTRKCDFCTKDDTLKEDMEVVVKEGKKKSYKYYHKDCYPRFLKRQAFREKERKELDRLTEVIKEIYGVKVIPNSAFPLLQDLRNGNQFFGKKDGKFKQGYSYALIADTFEYVSESIERANATKSFSGGFGQAFRYGLAIVCDKLMVVEGIHRNQERQEQMIDLHTEKVAVEDFESSYKKKKKSNDITEFLDD